MYTPSCQQTINERAARTLELPLLDAQRTLFQIRNQLAQDGHSAVR
ncbi:hypothetical protein [uncultured Marinobacter sp.]|nr:hypothetical protein [uncultured Marinobacter sp.]